MLNLIMRHFKIKTKQAQKILNLSDELEFCDQTITMTDEYNNNPLNDMDIEDKITKAERIGYFDINGNQHSKEFIDLYYEEVR